MKKLTFIDRLQLMAAGIDFLLNHPKVKFTEFQLGVMLLRQTALFGKSSDTITLSQLSRGVRNLNRGTGRSTRRLSRASALLAELGFISKQKPDQSWRGLQYSLDRDHILRSVEALRKQGSTASAPGCPRRESEARQNRSAPPAAVHALGAPPTDDTQKFMIQLDVVAAQKGTSLGPVSRRTAINALKAAVDIDPTATSLELLEFIAHKLSSNPTRFESWGGVIHFIRDDFMQPLPRAPRPPQQDLNQGKPQR